MLEVPCFLNQNVEIKGQRILYCRDTADTTESFKPDQRNNGILDRVGFQELLPET